MSEENRENIPTISPEVAATLFEQPSGVIEAPEPDEDIEEVVSDPSLLFEMPEAPEDTLVIEEESGDNISVTPEAILDAIMDKDDLGHSPCTIVATIEKLHNVEDNMDLSDVPDDDHEYIDDIAIEDCEVDVYTLDGMIFNLVLRFDNAKSVYLKELNELCNRYRTMQEDMATNPDADPSIVPMLSIIFMPLKMHGQGAMTVSFPIGYFRTLDDDGINCSFHMQFWNTNVSFTKIDIDDESKAELTADVLRELEEGTSGQLFED